MWTVSNYPRDLNSLAAISKWLFLQSAPSTQQNSICWTLNTKWFCILGGLWPIGTGNWGEALTQVAMCEVKDFIHMACLRPGRFFHGRCQVSDEFCVPCSLYYCKVGWEGRKRSLKFWAQRRNFGGVLHMLRLHVGLKLLTPQASLYFGSLSASLLAFSFCVQCWLWSGYSLRFLPVLIKHPVGIPLFSLGKPLAFCGWGA